MENQKPRKINKFRDIPSVVPAQGKKLPPPMTVAEYDALVQGEKVQDYDPVKTGRNVRPPAIRSIPGPFPRLVADGETFTKVELLQQGLVIICKHGRATVQLRK